MPRIGNRSKRIERGATLTAAVEEDGSKDVVVDSSDSPAWNKVNPVKWSLKSIPMWFSPVRWRRVILPESAPWSAKQFIDGEKRP